jgi:hypothetical protein
VCRTQEEIAYRQANGRDGAREVATTERNSLYLRDYIQCQPPLQAGHDDKKACHEISATIVPTLLNGGTEAIFIPA